MSIVSVIARMSAKSLSVSMWPNWLPPVMATLVMLNVMGRVPAWIEMWLWGGVTFFSLKWLTWRSAITEGLVCPRRRAWAYFLLWPGMDPMRFCGDSPAASRGRVAGWLCAVTNLALGLILLGLGVRHVVADAPLVAAWLGLIGIVLVLHFGLFQLTALAWHVGGVAAEPIMNCPAAATSLADFWGRRWNRAFRFVADRYVYQPLARRLDPRRALLTSFFFSGLVHDLVISLPARAGYGLPTLYFMVQGAGILLTHAGLGRRVGIHRGMRGRLFAATLLVAPLSLLFHRPFLELVALPMLRAIGCY